MFSAFTGRARSFSEKLANNVSAKFWRGGMNGFILKNSLAGITATAAAVSFGYFAAQYFGLYMMLAISTGMFGLGAAINRTQQSLHQQFLEERLVVTEPKVKLTQSDEEVKKQRYYLTNKSPAKANLRSMAAASRFVRTQEKGTKFAKKSQSYGYCRKRLARCHQAKVENSTKAIPKG